MWSDSGRIPWHTDAMRGYGQFCPVAKASEILAERWTPLIIRELLLGSRRFNELEQGVPRVPRSLLVQRLRRLEQAGLVTRRTTPGSRMVEYHLTEAGRELMPVIEGLGAWGQRWVNRDVGDADIDPALLMWDMRRRIYLDRLPPRRVTVQVDFRGAREASFWMVLEPTGASVCLKDPGFECDLLVTADTLTLHRVWIGRAALTDAIARGSITVEGSRALVRAFPEWLAMSMFASIDQAPASPVDHRALQPADRLVQQR